ncbi:hypothetical protein [Caudoviricetes sp.]|nr:hypothetical protein [Caudoviricetes sp.]
MKKENITERERLALEIKRATEDFIKSGGVVQKIPVGKTTIDPLKSGVVCSYYIMGDCDA